MVSGSSVWRMEVFAGLPCEFMCLNSIEDVLQAVKMLFWMLTKSLLQQSIIHLSQI